MLDGQPGEWTKRETGQRVTHDLHIKMVAPGWTGSCDTGIRLTSVELPSLLQPWFKTNDLITLFGRRSYNKSYHLAYHAIFRPYRYEYAFVWRFLFYSYLMKASFQKRQPQWRFFKTLASRLCVDGRERRFLKTMMSYIMYTISITLSLWAMLPYFHRFSVCMRTSENHWNTLRVEAYFFLTI